MSPATLGVSRSTQRETLLKESHAARDSDLEVVRAMQGFDLVFGGVLDHFLARETALARPDMPLLDRFFRA